MTEKLLTLMLKHIINVFCKFYEDKFADCDTGLLMKDGWNDQSWFLMAGKSRKIPQKDVMFKGSKCLHVLSYNCKMSV